MSKDRIKKHKIPYEEGYAAIPNKLFHDKRLSVLARFVLMYFMSNSDTWVVYTCVAADQIGVNEKTITGAIRDLYNLGFIRRERVRNEKGHFSHWEYEVHHEPVFQNEAWEAPKKRIHKKPELLTKVDENPQKTSELSLQGTQPAAIKPPVVKPPVENSRLPKPNQPMPNKPMAMKAMPSYSRSFQAMDATRTLDGEPVRGRKFRRSQELEDTFQMLLSLQIRDEKGEINEDALSYLASQYSRKKLEDTYYHMRYKIENDAIQVKKSPLALYRFLLNNEHNCITPNDELNQAFARKFAFELGWGTLEFKEKYVIDKNNSSKDISFNLEPAVFRELLGSLYMGLHANYGT